jgi:uncharacterized protein
MIMHSTLNDAQLTALLTEAKTIAVVGLSSNPMRASFGVAQHLQSIGYRIIPVNPKETEVLGEKSYASLLDVPDSIDIVDVFRRSDGVPEVVDEAIKKGTRCVWMQEGVVHEEAAANAQNAGIAVLMDVCILKELRRLLRK